MRRAGLLDGRRRDAHISVPRTRAFGSRTISLGQRLSGVLSLESIFRLVLAFVLATALWLYVNSRNAPDASIGYPQPISVAAENVPANLTIRNTIPPVHVDIRPNQLGIQIPPSSFIASVNLQGFGAGVHRHVPVHLSWDPSVSVVGYTPRATVVVLAPIVSKDIPLQIHVLSAPAYGYALKDGSLFATPSIVRVSGPRQVVQQISKAVVFVSLGSARSHVNSSYAPSLENAQGHAISSRLLIDPARVRVHAVIEQLAAYKTLPILPSIHGDPAAGFGLSSIQVTPAGLTAYGSPKVLDRIRHLRTRVLGVAGLRAGVRTFRVRLKVPHGVFTPRRWVSVKVAVGPVNGAASFTTGVTVIGNTGHYEVTFSPGAVLVTIDGPAPALAAAVSRVRTTIDVAGLSSGTYSLPIRVSVPPQDRLDAVGTKFVRVTLRSAKGH